MPSQEAVMTQSKMKKLVLGFVKDRADAKAFLKDKDKFLSAKKIDMTKKSKRILGSIAKDLLAKSQSLEGGHYNFNTHTDYNASDGHANTNSHTDQNV
jgi:hypothetical protein